MNYLKLVSLQYHTYLNGVDVIGAFGDIFRSIYELFKDLIVLIIGAGILLPCGIFYAIVCLPFQSLYAIFQYQFLSAEVKAQLTEKVNKRYRVAHTACLFAGLFFSIVIAYIILKIFLFQIFNVTI